MASLCDNPNLQMTSIERLSGNDLSLKFKVRWKKATDPDTAYLDVTTMKTFMGLTIPYFDPGGVPESGDYIVHSYDVASGPTTGTKITVHVECEALV